MEKKKMEKKGNREEEKMGIKGNGRKCEERKKLNENYYLLRMIINKSFCFCIHFFNFDIQYIDNYSIERKCIPYMP